MDGASVAAAIKSDPSIRNTFVLLLTSIGDQHDLRKLVGSAVDACLVKPVRQSHLLNTLVNVWSRKRPETPSGSLRPRPAAPTWNAGSNGSPLRVLVAEDNIVNQKVAVRMLEKLGVRADVAANGREAVAMFEMLPYDLIFMDCQMPEMNGYEATAEIRRRAGPRPNAPIVAMTAEAIAGCRERCLEAGMDDYISKPVSINAIAAALRKWAPREAAPAEANDKSALV